MSEGRVYSGGLPVRPDIERLRKAFEIEAGKLITHAEIEAVIGLERTSNRYRTIVAAWRRMIERETALRVDAELNVGLRILDARQATSTSGRDVVQIYRKTRKAAIRVDMIDTAGMSEELRSQHSLVRHQLHRLNEVTRQARKTIAEPAPITALAAPKLVKS